MRADDRYQVRCNASGRYEVCERGTGEAIASFPSEPEASAHARRLAARADGGPACASGEAADSPVKDF